jgi:hypothetical protein
MRWWNGVSWTAQTTRLGPLDGSLGAVTDAPIYHVRVEHDELRTKGGPPSDVLADPFVGALAGSLVARGPRIDGAAGEPSLEQLESERVALMASGRAIRCTQGTGGELSGEALARVAESLGQLALRAYDAEADTLIRTLRPHALESAMARLDELRASIAELGAGLELEITDEYHALRTSELRLTAEYLAQLAQQRERERLASTRLEEEEREYRRLETERRHLEAERAHYAAVVASLRATEDDVLAAEAEQHLTKLSRALEDVTARISRLRAGYVYVVSNVGAFGENIVKIGLTRRQDPHRRVSELGGDAVPFAFDIHAMVFSNDAVSLVSALHRELAERRVNLVNESCDFFFATPQEARQALLRLHGEPLTFVDQADATEWRRSELERQQRRRSRPSSASA